MYCFVEHGIVVDGPTELPTNWRNISNLPVLDDTGLAVYGWLPVVAADIPVWDGVTHQCVTGFAVTETNVTPVYSVTPLTTEQATTALEQARRNAIERINNAAGQCRAKYITVIPGQDATYQLKETDALAAYSILQAGGTVTADDAPMIVAEALATNASVADTVALVLAVAKQWRALAVVIEAARRGANVAIAQATTTRGIAAASAVVWP